MSNIPWDTGSYDEPMESNFLEFAKKNNIPITVFNKIHRKGKPKLNVNRKVMIKFMSSKERDNVYKSRKSLSDGLFVQDNITPFAWVAWLRSPETETRELDWENMDRELPNTRSAKRRVFRSRG